MMTDEQVIQYFKQHMEKVPITVVKERLVKMGLPASRIQHALAVVMQSQPLDADRVNESQERAGGPGESSMSQPPKVGHPSARPRPLRGVLSHKPKSSTKGNPSHSDERFRRGKAGGSSIISILVKLLMTIVVLTALWWVIGALPPLKAIRLPSAMPFTLPMAINAIFGTAIALSVWFFGGAAIREMDIVLAPLPQAQVIVRQLRLTVFLLILYSGWHRVAERVLARNSEVFTWLFALVILIPVFIIAVQFFKGMDSFTSLDVWKSLFRNAVTCSSCGCLNKSGAQFCRTCGDKITAEAKAEDLSRTCYCGQAIEPTDIYCPQCGRSWEKKPEQTEPQPINCTKCGHPLRGGSQFCAKCGETAPK